MESEDSNHSLLSRRQSEPGSRYMVESGVFMSAFAATIFVAGLITVGVLMLASVVALSVMLNSCHNRNNSGDIQLFRTDEHYCHLLAFHSELNNLQLDELPTSCRPEGFRFLNELNLTIQLVEVYFSTLKANGDGLDVIVVDGDDLILLPHSKFNRMKDIEGMRSHARSLFLRLYMNLQSGGWSLICFTRKHVGEWNATVESLNDAGYNGWNSLIMRSDDELLMESWEYLSRQRTQLVERGFRITGLISSRMDSFRGSNLGQRNFKLANPAYYHLPT